MTGEAKAASGIGHSQKVSVTGIMDIMACRAFNLGRRSSLAIFYKKWQATNSSVCGGSKVGIP